MLTSSHSLSWHILCSRLQPGSVECSVPGLLWHSLFLSAEKQQQKDNKIISNLRQTM